MLAAGFSAWPRVAAASTIALTAAGCYAWRRAAAHIAAPEPIVLRYWDCRGRGQAARLILTDALGPPGDNWVDERVSLDAWGDHWVKVLKHSTAYSGPMHTMPVLEYGGQQTNQSLAVAMLAAELTGRESANALSRAFERSVMQLLYEDLSRPFSDALWARSGKGAAFLMKEVKLPDKLLIVERVVGQRLEQSAFLSGPQPGVPDFYLLAVMDTLDYAAGPAAFERLMQPFHAIRRHCATLRARPHIAELLATSPERFTCCPDEVENVATLRADMLQQVVELSG